MTRAAARTCSSCGTLNKPTWEFCARCGEPLEAAAASATARSAPAANIDRDFVLPWRPLLMAALAAAAIAGAFAVRRAGLPQAAAFLTAPTVPPAPVAAPTTTLTPERTDLLAGRRLLAQGDLNGALEVLARAAGALPMDPSAQHTYAKALWQAGQREAAVARLRTAAALGTDTAVFAVDLARALSEMGQDAAAREVLEDAVVRHPDETRILQDLGQAYLTGGEAERALPLLRHAAEQLKDDPRIIAQLGLALEKTGARAEAIPLLQMGVDRYPSSPTMRTLLADALAKDGRHDEAMQVLEGGFERTGSAILHRTRGAILERQGQQEQAAQAYRDYVRLAPQAPDAKDLEARAGRLEKRGAGVQTASSS